MMCDKIPETSFEEIVLFVFNSSRITNSLNKSIKFCPYYISILAARKINEISSNVFLSSILDSISEDNLKEFYLHCILRREELTKYKTI